MSAATTAIAVLPFLNLSSDPENEYFSDGITEEIITALSGIESLKVSSRRSAFAFKGKEVSLAEIAGQLGVNVILEGSVRVAGDMLRITAQLVQAEDDYHFWSESWDRRLENIFAIQDEISLLVADKLREQYGHFAIGDRLVKKQTDSLDAYAYSLRGNYYFNKWNPEDVRTAIGLYEKAIDLDPGHVESYVGLADAWSFLAVTQFVPPEEGWERAKAYIQKALKLDPGHAGAHYQLANESFFAEFDFSAAVDQNRRSLELRPNYPEALRFMSFLEVVSDRPEEGEGFLQRVLLLDPINQETLFFRAFFYYRKGDFGVALDQTEECLADNPHNIPAYVLKAYCLLELGRYDDLLAFLDEIPPEIVVAEDHLGLACLAYIRKGDEEKAAELMDELQQAAKRDTAFQAHSYLFLAYVNAGDMDLAFTWLEQSLDHQSSILLLSFTDPMAAAARSDPRYASFHRRLYGEKNKESRIKPEKAPLLDEATANDYEERLLRFMEEERPFLNPALSLRLLAGQLNVHPNQLSWVLNERVGENFNTFVNRYRVEHFKGLATDPNNAHISLLGLAYESGFNSKTVFNASFKKIVGTTPRAFLRAEGK